MHSPESCGLEEAQDSKPARSMPRLNARVCSRQENMVLEHAEHVRKRRNHDDFYCGGSDEDAVGLRVDSRCTAEWFQNQD